MEAGPEAARSPAVVQLQRLGDFLPAKVCPLAALPRVTRKKTLFPPPQRSAGLRLSRSSGALLCSSSAEVCSSTLLFYEGCPEAFLKFINNFVMLVSF